MQRVRLRLKHCPISSERLNAEASAGIRPTTTHMKGGAIMRFLTRSHVGSSEMEQRELWLTQLSDDELLGLSPWDILLTKNAQRFLLSVGRSVLREFSYHGLTRMSKDELLHEMYTDLADEIPGILEQCVRKANADQRDQYIFGSLQNVIRWRLTNFVFGTNRPRRSDEHTSEL